MDDPPWSQRRWLVASSCFFFLPAIYAHHHGLYGYALLLAATSAMSVTRWAASTTWTPWLVDADVMVATTNFMVFFVTGLAIIKKSVPRALAYLVAATLVLLFYLSVDARVKDLDRGTFGNEWAHFHFLFHFGTMCGQFLVLSYHPQIRPQGL